MTRKPHHQKDYDNGDRRLREAAERAWRVLNPAFVFTTPQKKLLAWTPMGVPKGALGLITETDDKIFQIWLNGHKQEYFHPICNVKDLPFDNLGI